MKTEEKCISLYKISCTREYMSRISVFSCQICLQGICLMIIRIAGCSGFVLVAHPAVRVRLAVVAYTYAFVR